MSATTATPVASAPQVEEVAAPAPANAVERVYQLPIVHDACGKASSLYTQAREYNQYTQDVFAKCEGIVSTLSNYIAQTEAVKKYEGPVNEFIVSQLEKLETSYPIVKAPTEEVFAAASKTAEEAKTGIYNYVHASA